MSRRSQEPSISHQHSTPNSKGSQVARVHPEEYLATLQTIDAHKPEFNISPLQSNNRIIHIRNIDNEIQELRSREDLSEENKPNQDRLYLQEDEGLFGQEVSQKALSLAEEDAYKDWDISKFLESLFYHLTFFLFLGPFCNILFYKRPGVICMRNMKFWGMNSGFANQGVVWSLSMASIMLYYFAPSKTATFEELLLVWFVLGFRCVAISAKYATYTQDQWRSLKEREWGVDEFREQLYMLDWREQTSKIVLQETLSSIERHQYESSNFHLEFMVQPTTTTKKQLSDTLDAYNDRMDDKLKVQVAKVAVNRYSGYQIFLHLLRGFNYHNSSISFLLSFIFAVATIATVFIALGQMGVLMFESNLDIARHVFNSCNLLFGITTSYCFLIEALRDLDRRTYLVKQCCYLISPNKLNLDTPKLLPTLNPIDIDTLHSWNMIRGISMDYGQKYYLRTQGFYSLVLLFCIAEFILVLLFILDIYTPEPFTIVVVGEQAIMHYLLIALYMIKGAILNSYFPLFQNLLDDTKSMLVDMLKISKGYFATKTLPVSGLHTRTLKHILDLGHKKRGDFELYTETLIRAVENAKNKLDYDQRNNSVKMYGIFISFALIQSVGVALCTVLGFAGQQRTQNRLIKEKLASYK